MVYPITTDTSTDAYVGGIVKMVHHPLQWKIRQSPQIYQVFSQILEESKLWVTLDRGKIVPPSSFQGDLQKGFIHWDINTTLLPRPIPIQGLVALTDALENQGGFQCVPGFHHQFEKWKMHQPDNRDPYRPNLNGLKISSIPMEAGDLVIWNSLIPHGNGPNITENPRIAQIVRMFPCELYDDLTLKKRLDMWKYKLPYEANSSDIPHWKNPKLSNLGEKLMGIRKW